jgi:hypothetical protein
MIKIIIHIFPHELIEYKRVIHQLNTTELVVDVCEVQILSCLNLNEDVCVINDPRAEITYEFKKINSYSDLNVIPTINLDTNIAGVNEHRRTCINESSDEDMLIFIDSDLHFHSDLLMSTLINATKLHEQQDYFILTPQCVRLWDTTWDCLVNERFIKQPLRFCDTIIPEHYSSETYGCCKLTKLSTFKWAGGWFTCISSKLAKLIGIPSKFVGYGPDDTFMMECCKHLKRLGWNVTQYIQSGWVVCEDRTLIKKNRLFFKNNINFRDNCNSIFYDELSFFKKRIQSNIYNNNGS